MDEISVLMSQFQVAIKLAVEAEVRRQISAQVGGIVLNETPPPIRARKAYAKSQPKPCPTCGVLNHARRFRYACAEHRS